MDWIERLNHAVNYIEEHLTEKIDYDELSRIIDCPSYHFQKMFFYMTDLSLSEYIRRRRMSLAAVGFSESVSGPSILSFGSRDGGIGF